MELFIAFLLFMVVAFGVLYNLAKWLVNSSNKQKNRRLNNQPSSEFSAKQTPILTTSRPESDKQKSPIDKLSEDRIKEKNYIQNIKEKFHIPEYSNSFSFDNIFEWETSEQTYTLILDPKDSGLKFKVYIPNKQLYVEEGAILDISLDDDKLLMFENPLRGPSVIAPVSGIYDVLFHERYVYTRQAIAKISTDPAIIQEYEDRQEKFRMALMERAKKAEEEKLILEKREIANKIKERHRRAQLEKLVRQELIDSGELYGDQPKRPPIPREVVDAVYRRDGGRCVYCGSTENLQLDHIIPFSKGGATTIENLQLLCQKCNLEKSNKIG